MKLKKVVFEKQPNVITFDEVEKMVDENNNVVLIECDNDENYSVIYYDYLEGMWALLECYQGDKITFEYVESIYNYVHNKGNKLFLANTTDEIVPQDTIHWDDIKEFEYVLIGGELFFKSSEGVKSPETGSYIIKTKIGNKDVYYLGKVEF